MIYNVNLVKKEYDEVLVEANSEKEALELIKNNNMLKFNVSIESITIKTSDEQLRVIEDYISSNQYSLYDIENLKVSANSCFHGCGDYCVLNTKFGGCPFKNIGTCSSKTIQQALANIGIDYKDNPSYHYQYIKESE